MRIQIFFATLLIIEIIASNRPNYIPKSTFLKLIKFILVLAINFGFYYFTFF